MWNKVVKTVRIAIANLGTRMKRGGEDASAALVRVFLALAVLLYLLIKQQINESLPQDQQTIVYLSFIYLGYAFLQWLSNLVWPGANLIRRALR